MVAVGVESELGKAEWTSFGWLVQSPLPYPSLPFPLLPLSWLHQTAILFLWSCECIALACGKITPAQTLFFPNPPAEFSLLIKKLIMARAGRPFFKARRNAIWPPPNADVIIDRRGRDCVPYGFLTQPRLEHLAVDVSELATHFHFISLYSKCRTWVRSWSKGIFHRESGSIFLL